MPQSTIARIIRPADECRATHKDAEGRLKDVSAHGVDHACRFPGSGIGNLPAHIERRSVKTQKES